MTEWIELVKMVLFVVVVVVAFLWLLLGWAEAYLPHHEDYRDEDEHETPPGATAPGLPHNRRTK